MENLPARVNLVAFVLVLFAGSNKGRIMIVTTLIHRDTARFLTERLHDCQFAGGPVLREVRSNNTYCRSRTDRMRRANAHKPLSTFLIEQVSNCFTGTCFFLLSFLLVALFLLTSLSINNLIESQQLLQVEMISVFRTSESSRPFRPMNLISKERTSSAADCHRVYRVELASNTPAMLVTTRVDL